METATLRVVEDKNKRLFEIAKDNAVFRVASIPIGLDFAGGHLKANHGQRVLADFDICRADAAWGAEEISYIDGLKGHFKSIAVVGTSELNAKNLSVDDTVTLTMPEGRIDSWLKSIKATAQKPSPYISSRYSKDDWAYEPE